MGLMKEMLKPTFGGDWGAANGETVSIIQQHGDGDITVSLRQDPSRDFRINQIRRNEEGFDGYNADRDFQHVATVPLITALHWYYQLGVSIWNPEHLDRVFQLIDQKDFDYCKIVKGSISRVHTKQRLYSVPSYEPPAEVQPAASEPIITVVRG